MNLRSVFYILACMAAFSTCPAWAGKKTDGDKEKDDEKNTRPMTAKPKKPKAAAAADTKADEAAARKERGERLSKMTPKERAEYDARIKRRGLEKKAAEAAAAKKDYDDMSEILFSDDQKEKDAFVQSLVRLAVTPPSDDDSDEDDEDQSS